VDTQDYNDCVNKVNALNAVPVSVAPWKGGPGRGIADLSAEAYCQRLFPAVSTMTSVGTATATAVEVHNLVRAVAPPWPGAFTSLDGRMVKILDVSFAGPVLTAGEFQAGGAPGYAARVPSRGMAVVCGGGSALLVTRVQPEGRPAQDALAFLNGLRREAITLGT
jgi:methionyl-tRNA formyltransferase